jgi:hypothetical protein
MLRRRFERRDPVLIEKELGKSLSQFPQVGFLMRRLQMAMSEGVEKDSKVDRYLLGSTDQANIKRY